MQLWTGNEFTTCCADTQTDAAELPYKFREPFYCGGKISSRTLCKIVGYALVAVAGTAISCVCWWLAHR